MITTTVGSVRFLGCAVNSSGELYMVGGCPIPSSGSRRLGIVKLAANGNSTSWLRFCGHSTNANDGLFYGADVDSSGNILAAGQFNQSGGQGYEAILVKGTSSGDASFDRQYYESGAPAYLRDVVAVGSNYYLFGYIARSSNRPDGAFILKMNASNASTVWDSIDYQSDNGDDVRFEAGTVDSSGNVYAAGYHDNNTIFVKYNSSGTKQFAKKLSQNSISQARDIKVDSGGNLYMLCHSSFDGDTATVIKLDSSGSEQWKRTFSFSSRDDQGMRLAVTDTAVHICGWSYNSSLNKQPFIIKYPTDGSITGSYGDLSITDNFSTSYSNVTFTDAFSVSSRDGDGGITSSIGNLGFQDADLFYHNTATEIS